MHVSRQLGPFSGGGCGSCARCGINQVQGINGMSGGERQLRTGTNWPWPQGGLLEIRVPGGPPSLCGLPGSRRRRGCRRGAADGSVLSGTRDSSDTPGSFSCPWPGCLPWGESRKEALCAARRRMPDRPAGLSCSRRSALPSGRSTTCRTTGQHGRAAWSGAAATTWTARPRTAHS